MNQYQIVSLRVRMVTFLLLFGLSIVTPSLDARKIKTKHSIPKQSQKSPKEAIYTTSYSIISIYSDSVIFVEKFRPAIRFYGFDKTVTSNLESFFISNGLDNKIAAMELTITYLDMKGRQLHKRNVKIECEIPPHETIRTDIRSWDTQKSFYYHQSVKPRRQATPFEVKIDLQSIIL